MCVYAIEECFKAAGFVLRGVIAIVVQYLVGVGVVSVYLCFDEAVLVNAMSKNAILLSFSFSIVKVMPSVVVLIVLKRLPMIVDVAIPQFYVSIVVYWSAFQA